MSKNKKRIKAGKIAAIVAAAVVVAACLSAIIANLFIPVRYLSAYLVFREERTAGELRITCLDVGFGDSYLVELPDGGTMLIDGGDGEYSRVLSLLTLLNRRGVDRIDYLVCTSVKGEHCGGLAEIVRYKEVGKAFVPYCNNTRITEEYYAFISALRDSGTEYSVAEVGAGVCLSEDCFFSFLSPVNSQSPDGEYADLNKSPTEENIERASAVLWLEYGENAFLFTSDAREETLSRIVAEYELCSALGQPYCAVGGREVKLEKCDFVTVPGHGGKYNTYAPFYDLIAPSDAVVSVGENYAGYPDATALSDVYAYTEPYYTRYDGTITVIADAEQYRIIKENQ